MSPVGRLTAAFAAIVVILVAGAAAVHGAVDDTALVSRADGPAGDAANASAEQGLAVSGNGRYVAFASAADNLSAEDADGVTDVFVRDLQTGATMLVSRGEGLAGAPADGASRNPSISPGGTFVAFESDADNLSTEDDDSVTNIFLRDLANGTTTLVSRAESGSADGASGSPAVSANGAFVAFDSTASNLSVEDDDAVRDVFIRNMGAGTTRLLSKPATGAADGPSSEPSISSNGLRVAFTTEADNLTDTDIDAGRNVYVVDTRFLFLTQVNRTTATGVIDYPADGDSYSPAISLDGRVVAFVSRSSNLGASGALQQHVYTRDIVANLTTLISRGPGQDGAPGDSPSWNPSVSREGRVVAFLSDATNLGAGGDATDAYLRYGTPVQGSTLRYDQTLLASRASGASGAPADGTASDVAVAYDATTTAFVSTASNLGDDNPDSLARVYARESLFRVPPPPPPDLGSGDHHGGGGGEHGGHDAEAAHGHGSADAAHGHGGVHFSLRMGKPGTDRIFGTDGHDKACGLAGNDLISLRGGPDVAYGDQCGKAEPPDTAMTVALRHAADDPPSGPAPAPTQVSGNDKLVGGRGDDRLYGGAGRDVLVGGSGSDKLVGGPGRDRLVGGPGRNSYLAGKGDDSINARNGRPDVVDCGSGRDTARVDWSDYLRGCEAVKRGSKAASKNLPDLTLPECPGGGHECHKDSSGVIVVSRAPRE